MWTVVVQTCLNAQTFVPDSLSSGELTCRAVIGQLCDIVAPVWQLLCVYNLPYQLSQLVVVKLACMVNQKSLVLPRVNLLVGVPGLVPWEEWLILLALAEGLGCLNEHGEHAEH